MVHHLDDSALQALEAKDARAVAHFRDHLARPCPECEAFLASAPARLWWLEAEADRLLLLHGAAPAPAADASGYGAVRRGLRVRRLRRALGLPAAAAAAIAAGVLLLLGPLSPETRPAGRTTASPWVGGLRAAAPPPSPDYTSVKGPGEPGFLELSAVVVSRSGAAVPIGPGGRAREGDTLVLRYRAERAGPAHLVRSGPGGSLQALGGFMLSAGTHDLADEGGVAGVSLEGDRGEVRLWLVQSPSPLTAEKAVEAVRNPTRAGGARVAGFSVQVGTGGN